MSYFMGNGRADTCRNGEAYKGKAVEMMIDVLEARDGFELRKASDSTGSAAKFRIFWDGECISTVYNEKEARALFNDFATAIKRKAGRPKKNAA